MSAMGIRQEDAFEPAMNAMIIYEGCDAAKQANALLERAFDQADAMRWNVRPWRLEMLGLPPMAQQALREATEAHLIVLAICRRATVSPWLLDWLEVWAAHRQVQEAALALFDDATGDTSTGTMTPELSEFARRHGLSFIFGNLGAGEDESAAARDGLRQQSPAWESAYRVFQAGSGGKARSG